MVKILELFAGIGACSKAFTNLGIDHEIVDAVEIDKFAIASFNAVHGTNFEPQDIKEWDKDIEVDLIMHGSPCQDFSVAGLGAGGDEGSGTRSSLMYESIRIIANLKPKYVIWENVKAVLSKKHIHNFQNYLNHMVGLGYENYYQVLNAKDYGVPQNRERVFTVSIRADLGYNFSFPKPIPLTKVLKDILDPKVEDKYYLSDEKVQHMKETNWALDKLENVKSENKIGRTIRATNYKNPQCVRVGDLDMKGYDAIKRIYSPNGLSPTLTTMGGGNREPKIIDDTYAKRNARIYEDSAPILRSERTGLKVAEPFIVAMRGRNPENPSDRTAGIHTEQRLEVNNNGTSNTLTSVQKDNLVLEPNYRIRKLTAKECWRLMGFDDEDYEKAAQKNSKTQLYKQAGNSIVVNVLEAIIAELKGKGNF